MKKPPLDLILVTGMSGSGKSVALKALEDSGFYCVDNLPPELLTSFVELETGHQVNRIAIAIDARSATSLPLIPQQLDMLRSQGVNVKVVFLDAATDTLVHRFSETRRNHPLSSHKNSDQRRALTEAIELERSLLSDLREGSLRIDTSLIRSSQLQAYVKQLMAVAVGNMTLVFESFGFKRGVPLDVDFTFDVRMLPNPHYEPDLKKLTGKDAPVIEFLLAQTDVVFMIGDIKTFLARWLPKLEQDHRSYVTVAIGCTGGQHRSVFVADELNKHFGTSYATICRHRELDSGMFSSTGAWNSSAFRDVTIQL